MLGVALLVTVNVFLVTIAKLHIRSNTSLTDYVSSVSNVEEKIFASRGNIYDNSGTIVAQDVKTFDIICYLDPDRLSSSDEIAYVDNPSFAAQALAPILGMDASEIYDILVSNSGLYQIELGAMGRNLSKEQKEQIEAIEGLHGIDFRNSYKRYYPYGETFSPQLVGFAQSDNTGKLIGKLCGLWAHSIWPWACCCCWSSPMCVRPGRNSWRSAAASCPPPLLRRPPGTPLKRAFPQAPFLRSRVLWLWWLSSPWQPWPQAAMPENPW